MADNKSREVVGIESAGGAGYGEWHWFAETADGCKYAITEKEFRWLREGLRESDGKGIALDFAQVLYEAGEDGAPLPGGYRAVSLEGDEPEDKGESIEKDEAGDRELTIKVTADMAEAITGFKALQRELRETTKAIREYEAVVESIDGNFRIGTHSGEVAIVTTSELKSGDPSIGRDTDFVYRYKPDMVEATTNEGTLTTFDLSEVPTEELRNELAKRQ